MFGIGDNKFIHLKYKDLMMLAEEESFKETDKTISFNTKQLKMSTDGQIQEDNSGKGKFFLSFEIDNSSGVIFKKYYL